MAKLQHYGPPPAQPAKADTLRRQLDTMLAKALAYAKANNMVKARSWGDKLAVAMTKARLLSAAGHGDYVELVKRELRGDGR